MLLLLFAGDVFLFLLVGAVVFVACLVLPRTRRYALSAALWCAVWGPCSVGLMLVAGAGLLGSSLIGRSGDVASFQGSGLVAAVGWGYLILGVLGTIAVATAAAWAHQLLVRRFTFRLFRVYAALVAGGVGSVFGWALGWWMMAGSVNGSVSLALWVLCMVMLIVAFGAAAFRGARALREEDAGSFTWLSEAEYRGR